MKIGVDVSLLAGNLTGIGRYTHEVLKRLIESGHEWFLYSHDHINADYTERANVHLRTLKTLRCLPRIVSTQTTIPLQANLDKVDLFWSPTHRLPTFLSQKIARVLTIHDLVWKHASGHRGTGKFIHQNEAAQGVVCLIGGEDQELAQC